jgi:hypothetical protein
MRTLTFPEIARVEGMSVRLYLKRSLRPWPVTETDPQ